MIKINLSDVVNSIPVFNDIMKQTLTGSAAFRVARLARELDNEMKTFNESRRTLVEKYAVRDDNGELKADENGNIQIIPEKVNECNEEFNNLLNSEIEINANKLPNDILNEIKINPQQMMDIMMFVEE